MLPPPQPSPEYKHFCRVCNKGFTCGSALGGHMRAHGASDDAFAGADEDDSSIGDDEPARRRGGSDDQWDAAGTATHAYALRANPNRLMQSCQECKNCGKEFTSWERFIEHGRCNSDDDEEDEDRAEAGEWARRRRSLSPPSDAGEDDDPAVASAAGWSKGKRSRRVKSMAAVDEVPSLRCTSGEEEEDLANCLVMLSSSHKERAATVATTRTTSQQQHQEPSAPTTSRERDRAPQLLQPISFLAPAREPVVALPSAAATTIQYVTPAPRGLFECKACKKVFTSHQALGGHRASHKKVKGCYAARFDGNDVVSETPSHAATATDRNNDNGKAAAVVESSTRAAADAKPSIIYASTDGNDANVGTASDTATAALSMALAPVATFPVGAAPNGGKKNAKMHECSVCHRLFASGQALGGHKRCHWLTTSSAADPTNSVANLTVPPITDDLVGAVRHQLMFRPMADVPEPALDLTIAAKPSPLTAAPAGSSSFHLDASAPALHLQSHVVPGNASHRNRASTTSGHDGNDAAATASTAAEDEAESSTIKRARLTVLKDVVRMDGEATEPWLQVGIGSSSSAAGGDDKNTQE